MPRIPDATYRLQFGSVFTFSDAKCTLDYLKQLGISDIYASPFMMGGPEDLNGYQVTDHSQVNPKLGGEEKLRQLTKDLRQREMGLIADIVPNHMYVASEHNVWWNDVLQRGPSSRYAHYFDIDWDPPRAELKNQVLLPILGDQFGRVLERAELQIVARSDGLYVTYSGRALPLRLHTWSEILQATIEQLESTNDAGTRELKGILKAIAQGAEVDAVGLQLGALLDHNLTVRDALSVVLAQINGCPGDPRSFDALEGILDKQFYRLSFWRVANHEINYRRFFDINDLAGLCVEQPEVFTSVHKLIFQLIRDGQVTGLRIDHIDGLFDPEQYLQQLRQQSDCYLIVEKIFTGSERLRGSWPVHGTTGYDFLNLLNGVFVDEANRNKVRNVYFDFGGWHQDPFHLIYSCKRYVLSVALASERRVLAQHLDRLSEQHRYSRDFTFDSLQQALREVIACFPVYRSYIRSQREEIIDEDRGLVHEAVRRSRRFNPTTSPLVYDFLQNILLLKDPPDLTLEQIQDRRKFVSHFQQLTGPVMAKGVEDTAFYRAYPLASLNEVGGNPYIYGTSVDAFHRENAYRLKYWPHAMTTTSTHDTKRSEDVRARINVLSEIPERWEYALLRWRQLNEPLKSELEGELVPGGNEEYLFYQTVLGVYPLNPPDSAEFIQRIQGYMGKATKEAKVYTSWVNPNESYDQLLSTFIEEALNPEGPFVQDLHGFLSQVVRPGLYNSLAQVVMKLAVPGVPDFYQGQELWDFSLVDPDNRHQIDYGGRPALLDSILSRVGRSLITELLEAPEDGRLKLYVTALGLGLRKKYSKLFQQGCYTPSEASGAKSDQVIGFSRCHEDQIIVAAVGRFFTRFSGAPLRDVWEDTMLTMPPGQYRDIYTLQTYVCRGELPVRELFSALPLCLLEKVG